jgi:hypothetical protein
MSCAQSSDEFPFPLAVGSLVGLYGWMDVYLLWCCFLCVWVVLVSKSFFLGGGYGFQVSLVFFFRGFLSFSSCLLSKLKVIPRSNRIESNRSKISLVQFKGGGGEASRAKFLIFTPWGGSGVESFLIIFRSYWIHGGRKVVCFEELFFVLAFV